MRLLDPSQLKLKASCKCTGKLLSLCADARRYRLYAGDTRREVQVFDLSAENFEPLAKWDGHENYVAALAFLETAGGPRVVSGGYDGKLVWRDAETGKSIRQTEAHGEWIRDLILLGDSQWLASCGDDMAVRIWDGNSGELIHTLSGHARQTPQGFVNALYAIAATADGSYLASGDRVGEVRIWEAKSGRLIQSIRAPEFYTFDSRQRQRSIGGIRSLAFSPDSARLAIGGIGQVGNVDALEGMARVEVWDWQAEKLIFSSGCQEHKAIVNALAFTRDGDWLAGVGGGSGNGLIAWWKNESPGGEPKKKKGDPVAIHGIKTEGHWHRLHWDEENGRLIVAGHEKIEIWQVDG